MWLIGGLTNAADNCPLGFQTLLNQRAFSLGFPNFDSLQSAVCFMPGLSIRHSPSIRPS